MYNRFVYERDQKDLRSQQQYSKSLDILKQKSKKVNEELANKYKTRVNDFLVQMANQPLKLGSYIPPIKNIIRSPQRGRMLSDPQLYINGFRTSRQRVQKAIYDQKILDLSPMKKSISQSKFRPREYQKQIQQGMKFASKNTDNDENNLKNSKSSLSSFNLPQINPKIPRMHFKAIQQFGHEIKSMKLTQNQMTALLNRLQTIAGSSDVNPINISLQTLKKCNLTTSKLFKAK